MLKKHDGKQSKRNSRVAEPGVKVSLAFVLAVFLLGTIPERPAAATGDAMRAYLIPYVTGNNFSGSVVVRQRGHAVFEESFGLADRAANIPNTRETSFHVASMSMQFTAVAVLRLIAERKIAIDESVASIVPSLSHTVVGAVTVRQLLEQRSGLADLNGLPQYGAMLESHQTPDELVRPIANAPIRYAPGSAHTIEEHSAYNVLALIVETVTKEPFADAVQQLVFAPLRLAGAGIDDDRPISRSATALGYVPVGLTSLQPAPRIHWSAKAGNGSAYLTAAEEATWAAALFTGSVLPAAQRQLVFDPSNPVGYGWFKRKSTRFNQFIYLMNGRAPGFSSFVLYLPKTDLVVVVLSNVYSSATTPMGLDLAAIALGLPYESFHPSSAEPAPLAHAIRFRFGPNFYVPNGVVILDSRAGYFVLHWPDGSASVLIPIGSSIFVDRAYWERVAIVRDHRGGIDRLYYDTYVGMPE